MLSDRGNEVDSGIMRAVCDLLDIDKMRTTSYRPSTNGAVGRFHRTLNSMLGKVVPWKHTWALPPLSEVAAMLDESAKLIPVKHLKKHWSLLVLAAL